MTAAEPEDAPVEPTIAPARTASADETVKPKATVIEHEPKPRTDGAGGGLFRALAAGLVGGLLSGSVASLVLGGGGGNVAPKPDEQARLAIRELQDKIKDQADKAAQLSETVRSKLAQPAKAASPDELNELRTRLDEIANAAKSEAEAVDSLTQKVKTLEEKPAPQLDKEAVDGEIASQIAPVTERLSGIERSQNEKLVGAANTAALSIAFTNLKKAIADGKPFASELSAIELLAPQKLPVFELAPYKDKGVASLVQLKREFTDAAGNAIVQYYHGKSGSFLDEVLSRAHGAIQVKPVGGAGDTVEAILGRMESALNSGDVKAALSEGEALDNDAKKELKVWFDHAQARAAADEAVRATDQELLASLKKSSAVH